MPDHNLPLIATLASAFGLALVLGLAATRLRLPALVGYLLAGLIIGPFTPGYVADVRLSGELAEIGIMLLMFGVGLHFSLEDLLQVRRIAVPGALLQIAVATLLGAAMAWAWGWPLPGALVFGLALSVASTVVLLRALESRGLLASLNGRIAVGWLIVEDLAMVLVLVLLPALSGLADNDGHAGSAGLWRTLGVTVLEVLAFLAFMLAVGRKLFPRLLWLVAREGSRELFTLCVVAVALGIAFAAGKLFGVSFALGAFLAGMVMRESEFSHRAAVESLPLRAAGLKAVTGDAVEPEALIQAHIAHAAVLAVAIADTAGLRRMVETARTLNPGVKIIARTHSEDEVTMLQDIGVEPSLGEDALAAAMTARVVQTLRT